MEDSLNYYDRLARLHIKQLGQGAYSTVYQHPVYNNVVVRVFNKTDKGYMSWMRFVAKHPDNRYVPRIIPNEKGKLFYKRRVVEWDEPINLYFVFLKKYVALGDKKFVEFENTLEQFLSENAITKLERESIGGYYSLLQLPFIWKDLSQSSEFKFEFGQDAVDIAQFFSRRNYIDISEHNIMYDPTNDHIVFTDPLSS